ncbi:MAG: glycosyltransferase [Pirellulaceae bacterium]|nr:glycosyltransferase [Pirellulaceae bacterium]
MLSTPHASADANDKLPCLGLTGLPAGSPVGLPAGLPTESRGPEDARQTIGVLHVINGEHFSGAERVQQVLGQQLEKFGYSSHFACLKPGKFPEICGLPSERVHAAPMRGRFDWRAIDEVVDIATHSQCYLLHAHTPRAALVAAFAAHRLQMPWVYHVHSPTARDSTRGMINRINDMVEQFAIRSCDLLITVSRSLRREMLKRGVPRKRLVAVANGVAAMEPIEPASRLSQVTWRLGLIALMRPRKGVEVALQAMAKLKARGAAITLDLIGGFETPAYEATIVQMIDDLGLMDVVHLRGFTRDVAGVMRQLDGLVLPSLFGEGMPMVVLEALSAGVPVVATRVEGTPEVVRHGVEGMLAEPRDPVDLAQQIERLCLDRAEWAKMSQAAVARHRSRFSDLEMARGVARAYDRII